MTDMSSLRMQCVIFNYPFLAREFRCLFFAFESAGGHEYLTIFLYPTRVRSVLVFCDERGKHAVILPNRLRGGPQIGRKA